MKKEKITKGLNSISKMIHRLISEIMEKHNIGAINVCGYDTIYTAILENEYVQTVGVIVCHHGDIGFIPKDEMPFESGEFASVMEKGGTLSIDEVICAMPYVIDYELFWCEDSCLFPLETYIQMYEVLLKIFKDEKETSIIYG